MQPNPWVEEQIRAMRSLEGQTIDSWRGVEMAFAGGEHGKAAVFEDPAVPCRQFLRLDVALGNGTSWTFSTYQSDDGWGLCRSGDAPPLSAEGWDGIYRHVDGPDLPVGLISSVTVWVAETGELAELTLDVGDHQVLLVAGEVYEDWDKPLQVRWLDESMLVFTSTEAAKHVAWIPPRQPIRSS